MLAKHITAIYGKGLLSAKGLRCGEKHYAKEGYVKLAVGSGQSSVGSSQLRRGDGFCRRVLADGQSWQTASESQTHSGLPRRPAGDCEPYLGERQGVSAAFGEWNERWRRSWQTGSCGRPYFAKRYLQMDAFWFVTTARRGLRALPGGKERCFGCFRRVEREVAATEGKWAEPPDAGGYRPFSAIHWAARW